MAGVFLTTRHGHIQEIQLYKYRFSKYMLEDKVKKSKLINWLKYVSNYAILSIEKDGFITVEKLLPSQENSQYQYDKILSITPPFENIQLISNIIGLLIKKELSNNYQQYLNDNIFIISEVIISPFKILKCIEFNVEIFPTGDYLIHFLPVTKIIGDQSPITESYLSKLRTHFHTQNNNSKDIKCTLINKRNLYKVKLDILSNEAFSEIKPYINNNIIQLATFDYHFLAAYSEAIFQKIISETCKKLTDTIWFVDGVISNLSLTTLSGLSPDTYLNVDIVKLGEKPNLYVGCQYNETLTFHSISNTQYGLRVEYTRDNESQDVLICNFIKDQHLTNKLAKLNFPITVQGKTRYHKETNRFFLIDIFVDGNINAAKAIQQYAVYHTGIYKPVDNWSILPILYGINDISLFRELILAFNKKNIDILTPYIIQNNEIDTLELNRRIPQKKKVFMPVICKNQMPTNIISSIKSLKRKYQIFLGNTDDNKDNRARLSNYICKCLQKMGGIISLIADTALPVSGYFIGLDLGHTTHGNKKYSNIGVSLFNCHGLLVGNHVLKDLPRNEKLDYPQCKAVISELNKIILNKKLVSPTHIIIHRDGKLHHSDVESLSESIKDIWGNETSIDIVEIIKSGYPVMVYKNDAGKAENLQSGWAYQDIKNKYALLVTNTQADEYENLIRPIVIKHRYGNTDFTQIINQIYWLTKIYTNNLYYCTRLPATTQKANNIAGTSDKVHQASYLG